MAPVNRGFDGGYQARMAREREIQSLFAMIGAFAAVIVFPWIVAGFPCMLLSAVAGLGLTAPLFMGGRGARGALMASVVLALVVLVIWGYVFLCLDIVTLFVLAAVIRKT